MYKKYLESQKTISQQGNNNMKKQESPDDDKTDEVVKECWRIIDDQCKRHVASQGGKHGERRNWKVVRVFVSSTFSDFFSEREVLVRKVFPELREWCEGRKLQIVECDLRWGVPKDYTGEETISVCMEEIDRCSAENEGQPFFIGMLGERYGWIPGMKEIPEYISTKYDWVPNVSITCMEMLHGAYRSENPNAAFFIRNENILEVIPHDHIHRFQDSSILCQKQLKELKRRLKLKFPRQVFDYSCSFGGIKEQSGRQRVHLNDLEKFSEYIISFLKGAIERTYPPDNDSALQNEDDLENEQQKDFVVRKAEMVVGRNELLDNLMSYTKGQDLSNIKIKGEGKAFVRDLNFWESKERDGGLLVVTGPVGYGKSSILARHVQAVQKAGMPVFYHFVGSSPSSYRSVNICKRLAQELNSKTIDPPENENDLIKFYMTKVKEGMNELNKDGRQLLIVLDGLNELNERQAYSHLSWLPPSFPANIRCIVSSADDHLPTTHRLKEHPCFVLEVSPLNVWEAREMVKTSLLKFGKKLDDDQLETIVNQPCSHNPLWLWLLSEKLRVFGDFRTLDDRIKLVSESVDKLLWIILSSLISEGVNYKKFLCLVGVSENGVTTNDMINLLGNINDKVPLPPLDWALIRRLVLPYIRIMGINETIMFKHSAILSKVKTLMLSEDDERQRWHKYMVEYYLNWCENHAAILDNIPYHCKAANLRKEMLTFMRKHQISFKYSDWLRSHHLEMCRCRNMADPIIPASRPVVLCHGCSNSTGSFYPLNSSLNKNSCIICGSRLFPNTSVKAYTCLQHSGAQTQKSVKCFLCNVMVWLDDKGNIKQNLGHFGFMCRNCGFGQNGKRCSSVCER